MNLPQNRFKHALLEGRQQIGLWCSLPGSYVTEAVAASGFDWLLFDTEHSPGDVLSVLPQLQAVAAYDVSPIVRPASNDAVLIKRFLDIGAQTLVVPLVESAEQARAVVRATRYPPDGVRGVGSALARASRWNRRADYLQRADAEICVIVQAESAAALSHLDEITRVEGVDGVFLGPADLAASLGYRGEPAHPVVREALDRAIAAITAAGKAAGILSSDEALARGYLAAGCGFVAVGVDTTLLARATTALAERFKAGVAGNPAAPAG